MHPIVGFCKFDSLFDLMAIHLFRDNYIFHCRLRLGIGDYTLEEACDPSLIATCPGLHYRDPSLSRSQKADQIICNETAFSCQREGLVTRGDIIKLLVADPSHSITPMMIGKSNTIKELRTRIAEATAGSRNPAPIDCVINYNGLKLDDDKKTIKECKLKPNSVISWTSEAKGGLAFTRSSYKRSFKEKQIDAIYSKPKTAYNPKFEDFVVDTDYIIEPFVVKCVSKMS